jgi:1-deoxyxylulose-5-phosphate synthase
MPRISRRNFIKTTAAAGALAGVGAVPLLAEPQTAASRVTLGKSNVSVTRLAFGTGTHNGHVQQQLGQEEFTRLVHYAYDHGIRFFETAEAYVTPPMLGEALKGLPRDSYRLMNKVTTSGDGEPLQRLDDMRRAVGTDYFDIMLLHVQSSPTWPVDSKRWQDAILEAQRRQTIVTHGASIHGLPALRLVAQNNWLDIAMIRMNHKGAHMDNAENNGHMPGDVDEVVSHVHEARAAGMGVISMKLIGEGSFADRSDRQAAMRFAFRNAGVDAVTVGFKNTAEIDEAMENVRLAFA